MDASAQSREFTEFTSDCKADVPVKVISAQRIFLVCPLLSGSTFVSAM
jgi:hypothetical protein